MKVSKIQALLNLAVLLNLNIMEIAGLLPVTECTLRRRDAQNLHPFIT